MRRSPDFIQSLQRGLGVIRTFDADSPALTLTEVATKSGLTKATARRCLHTLVDLGYADFDGRLFSLRAKVLELGYSYLSALGLPDVARPHLEALAANVEEACSMAVLDGDDVAYVARVTTRRIMTVTIAVGSRFPAHATALGRLLMAMQPPGWVDDYIKRADFVAFTRRTVTSHEELRNILERIRADDYALNDQELEDGVRSIAVPLRDRRGHTVAAVNISASASRRTLTEMRGPLLTQLRLTATKIETDLARR